jgi:esterase/lipase superfamily enzyme
MGKFLRAFSSALVVLMAIAGCKTGIPDTADNQGSSTNSTPVTAPTDTAIVANSIRGSTGVSLGDIKERGILGGPNSFLRNPFNDVQNDIQSAPSPNNDVVGKNGFVCRLLGCDDEATRNNLNTPASKKSEFEIQKVYFGTDRQIIGRAALNVLFGVQRTKQLNYGEVDVSIPLDHRQGVLESPNIWHLEFHDDPEKHVTLLRTSTLSQNAFFTALRADIQASPKKNLLVFVHGFNVSFADAARRTAQMAYDLGFDGPPVFFSWPSQDRLASYTVDEQAIINAEPHLEQFLGDLLTQSDAENVYLIAHSMGNRGLMKALMMLALANPKEVKRIKEVVLAAPDIDTTEFTEQIAPALLKLGAPVTLYASSNDRALAASKRLHGGARAGESGDHLIVVNGIETIDASSTDTDLIGHSYYGDRRSVLADMWYLINGDTRASKRCCLQGVPSQVAPKYWVFRK